MSNPINTHVSSEAALRRTFAIISHPDAGKTTLTEKLLLYSGMIRTAGMVRGRKGRQGARSDWMAMEADRGISITASAMQFGYKGRVINVLDTPGHQDFSEDTYRTLTAADSAIMVIDAGKGVEAQTRKLFAVCRMQQIPILTFVNKLDMPSNDAFDLLSEIEDVLGIDSSPMNWPVGYGRDFVGIADVKDDSLTLFEKSAISGAERAKSRKVTIEQASAENLLSESVREQLEYELSLLKEAGNPFSRERFLAGELTPVFFGSALTNFGVEPFFDAFVDLAPSPGTRQATSDDGEEIAINPAEEDFSAFVFKIQANMDLRHRDSMAFLRICSGQFERDISIQHHRLDKQIRLSRSHSMFGGERETLDAAYPGDIVGVVNPGTFMIGDTISVRGGFTFPPMPQFPPEVVASLRPTDVSKRKQFDKGIKQLSSEGAIQLLRSWEHPEADPYIAAVGKLQFEVLQHRLENEYNVNTVLEIHPYQCGAWLEGNVKTFKKPLSAMLARDSLDRPIVLFRNEWEKKYAENQHPDHKFLDFASEYRLDK